MATYTNLSILQGWLEIDSLQTVTRGRAQIPVLLGWIYTTDEEGLEAVFSEQHPVLISDRPAKAVLEITRKLNDTYPQFKGTILVHLPGEQDDQPEVLVHRGRPFVIAQGKLITYEGRSYVDIRHISFLGLPWGALEEIREVGAGNRTEQSQN
jgi:hypothetical protein